MIAMPASAGPPSLRSKNAIWPAVGRLSLIVQATIVPLRGIVSGALVLPTLTCIPVVSLTTSQGAPGQLASGPVMELLAVAPPVVPVVPVAPVVPLLLPVPVLPLLPVVPVLPDLPDFPVGPVADVTPTPKPMEPISVSVPVARVGIASITRIVTSATSLIFIGLLNTNWPSR